MSNIYIQEPSTNGKVLLTTTVGDIDIELWSKEAPKASRNFVQLCMEGYYDNTIFHRLVPDFIVQGGDPDGTGEGGESVYGAPFKDEFHSRLRFVRRGLVAMANAGPNDNGSQFFFTLNQTPELQNKHTIFGKVIGQTLFNMLRLQEVETDENERPLEPHKIIKSEVLLNPFDDIIPRVLKRSKKEKDDDQKKVKSKSRATKNFSLLSFGEEAEEDEEQTFKASKKFSGRSKSSHDLIDDPNLSSVPVVDKRKSEDREDLEMLDIDTEAVRKKLKKEEKVSEPKNIEKPKSPDMVPSDDSKSKRVEEARKEGKKLQKDIKASKKGAKQTENVVKEDEAKKEDDELKPDPESNDFLEKFKLERQKYKNLKKEQNKKGKGREAQTLAMLSKFQSKLSSVKQLTTRYSDDEEEKETEEVDDNMDLSWMGHKLQFEELGARKVIDANIADEDRYEIHDPRNPLTQRRREASKKKAKQK